MHPITNCTVLDKKANILIGITDFFGANSDIWLDRKTHKTKKMLKKIKER